MPRAGLARLLKKQQDRLVTQLASDDWLSPLIDRAQQRKEPERWVRVDLAIHPSWGGSPCSRDIQLAFLGHRDAIKSQNRRRMDNGTSSHARWERYLGEDAGVLVIGGLRRLVNEPFIWSGECDDIVENPVTGRRHVVEVKTMHSERWARIPPQLADLEEMARVLYALEPKYVNQLTQYLVMLPIVAPEYNTERDGLFIFENTNTQEFKVRYLKPDDAMREAAFANAKYAQAESIAGRLIPPPFGRKSMTCRKCYREKLCYELQDGKEDVCRIVKDRLKEAMTIPQSSGLHHDSGSSQTPPPTPTEF